MAHASAPQPEAIIRTFERDRARQRGIGVGKREEPSERDRGVGRQRGRDQKRIARQSAAIGGPEREKRVQPVATHHHYRENPEEENLQIAAKQVEKGEVEQQPVNVGILHGSEKTAKRENSPPCAQPTEPGTQQKYRGKCERNDSNEEHRHIEAINESASPRHADLRQPGAQAELQRIIGRDKAERQQRSDQRRRLDERILPECRRIEHQIGALRRNVAD